MFLKKFHLILFAGLLALSLFGCSSDSDDKAPVAPDAKSQAISSEVMAAITAAYGDAYSGGKGETTKGSGTINFIGNGWTASGSWSTGEPDGYPAHVEVTFTWITYVYNTTCTLSSGTAYLEFDAPSENSFTYIYTGDFDVLYEGTNYDFSWDISGVWNNPNYTWTGTFTLDGTTYTYTYGGTAK